MVEPELLHHHSAKKWVRESCLVCFSLSQFPSRNWCYCRNRISTFGACGSGWLLGARQWILFVSHFVGSPKKLNTDTKNPKKLKGNSFSKHSLIWFFWLHPSIFQGVSFLVANCQSKETVSTSWCPRWGSTLLFEKETSMFFGAFTPAKIHVSPEKGPFFKGNVIFGPSTFRGHVSFQGGIYIYIYRFECREHNAKYAFNSL